MDGNKKLSKKRKTESKIEEIIDENAYLSHDDSSMMEDDVDKDPDWKKTPLYSRIRKLQVILCCRNHLNYDKRFKYLMVSYLAFLYSFCYQVDKRGCKT